MAVYASPYAARAANAGSSNAAESVKTVPQSQRVHVQPGTDAGYVKKVFGVSSATDTGP